MIHHTVEDNIVIASFNNGKYNSINLETLNNLADIIANVNENDTIRGLVLTGTGKVYCSGFDLGMFLGFKDLEETVAFFNVSEQVFMDLFMCAKPVVAALNGAAMAGGIIISMAADYRICKNHPKIQLGMSEIKLGLGLSVVQSTLMRYGLDSDKNFREVMYDAKRYDPEKALQSGLIDELSDEENLIPRAKEIIRSWFDNPGRAFNLLKYQLRKPVLDQMKHYLETENWQEKFNCMFHPETRASLEAVYKMMQG